MNVISLGYQPPEYSNLSFPPNTVSRVLAFTCEQQNLNSLTTGHLNGFTEEIFISIVYLKNMLVFGGNITQIITHGLCGMCAIKVIHIKM